MDPTTASVRELYEEFPYPSGPPVMRVGFDARLTLSQARMERPLGQSIHVLDAGCGRGVGIIAAAELQPDVDFTGIDLNRVALQELTAAAQARSITNLRTQTVDLMTLEGCTAPTGGFDVIHCSGVIHHMPDPLLGLQNLAQLLAPHGVMQLMVYSKAGRRNIHPIARAIKLIVDPDAPLAEQLKVSRQMVEVIAKRHGVEAWVKASQLDKVEFVDRYMHPQEVSFDVDGLWDLIESAGLQFLAWSKPKAWDLTEDLPPGELLRLAQNLTQRQRFQLMSEFREGGQLDLFLCHPNNGPREALQPDEVLDSPFAVHPEGTFELSTRNLWGSTRFEAITWCSQADKRTPLPKGPLATAGLILQSQNQPFQGSALVEALEGEGVSQGAAISAILELERSGILYRPHQREMAAAATAPRAEQYRAAS